MSASDRPTLDRPVLDRSVASVLDAATRLLVETPDLSLGALAARIGIGRTTLHRLFPTRAALLAALAHDALDHLEVVYVEAGLDGNDPLEAVEALVRRLVPLGPRLMFLLRAPELDRDPDVIRRSEQLDAPLAAALQRAQHQGRLDLGLEPSWMLECLFSVIYVAWERIQRGELAPREAAPLVVRTWLRGVAASPKH